jgi:hypothetical protein
MNMGLYAYVALELVVLIQNRTGRWDCCSLRIWTNGYKTARIGNERREEIENINTTAFPARLETHSRTTTPCAVSIPMPEVYSRITGARL